MPDTRPEATPTDTRLDENLVKWIPIVVPLFALLIAVSVFFIDAGVL